MTPVDFVGAKPALGVPSLVRLQCLTLLRVASPARLYLQVCK